VSLLQNECLPIFCPAYEIEVDGKCEPLVRQIQATSIRVELYTDQLPDTIQVNATKTNDIEWNTADWVRSTCLDIKWGHIAVHGVKDRVSNVIKQFRFTLTKFLNYDKGFVLRRMISVLEKVLDA